MSNSIDVPIIVVPGIMGSGLANHYELNPDLTWSARDAVRSQIFGYRLSELGLDGSGTTDAALDMVTKAHGLIAVAYAPLVTALRERSSAPVYPFAYDWRRSVVENGRELATFAQAVQMRWRSTSAASDKIHFACHSMGGLVFRAMLTHAPNLLQSLVDHVVFIGVPQQGSLLAVEAMARGEGEWCGGDKAYRKLARRCPGLYDLLPKYDALKDTANAASLDIFDPTSWQSNVLNNGVAGPEEHDFDVTAARLNAAKQAWATLAAVPTQQALSIVGALEDSTMRTLPVGGPPDRYFDFDGAAMDDGDGVVPYVSSHVPGVPTVTLRKQEARSLRELFLRGTVGSVHSIMCAMDEVQTIVSRYFASRTASTALLPLNMERRHGALARFVA